jgi:hypothetical protein
VPRVRPDRWVLPALLVPLAPPVLEVRLVRQVPPALRVPQVLEVRLVRQVPPALRVPPVLEVRLVRPVLLVLPDLRAPLVPPVLLVRLWLALRPPGRRLRRLHRPVLLPPLLHRAQLVT